MLTERVIRLVWVRPGEQCIFLVPDVFILEYVSLSNKGGGDE